VYPTIDLINGTIYNSLQSRPLSPIQQAALHGALVESLHNNSSGLSSILQTLVEKECFYVFIKYKGFADSKHTTVKTKDITHLFNVRTGVKAKMAELTILGLKEDFEDASPHVMQKESGVIQQPRNLQPINEETLSRMLKKLTMKNSKPSKNQTSDRPGTGKARK